MRTQGNTQIETHLALFAGAGIGCHALLKERGVETVGYVEWDTYCQRVIEQRIHAFSHSWYKRASLASLIPYHHRDGASAFKRDLVPWDRDEGEFDPETPGICTWDVSKLGLGAYELKTWNPSITRVYLMVEPEGVRILSSPLEVTSPASFAKQRTPSDEAHAPSETDEREDEMFQSLPTRDVINTITRLPMFAGPFARKRFAKDVRQTLRGMGMDLEIHLKTMIPCEIEDGYGERAAWLEAHSLDLLRAILTREDCHGLWGLGPIGPQAKNWWNASYQFLLFPLNIAQDLKHPKAFQCLPPDLREIVAAYPDVGE